MMIQGKKYSNWYYSIVVISLITLIGCSKATDDIIAFKPITSIAQATTINFIGHWLDEGEREMFTRNIARVYEFENQHINVNLKFPEEVFYDQGDRTSNERFTARVVAENITDWDIIRINSEYREVYLLLDDPDWAKKALVDFSTMDAFKKGTIPELITQKSLDEWNGIIPGPYIEGQYWALWTNQRVAQKIGIEVKQFGMTFDDFTNYLRELHNYNQKNPDDHIIPIFESFVWETTMAIAISLYASELGNPEEFLSGKITEKRLSAWEKTLEAMEIISKYQPLDPSWKDTEWSSAHNMMLDGECLFYVNGSWMYNIWKGIDEQKVWDILPCEFPSFKPHKIYPAAYQIPWGVPKNAPNRDEAVKFLMAMNSPAIADMWNRYTKCPTGVKGNLTNEALGGDQYEIFSYYVQNQFKTNTYRYHDSGTWVLDHKSANTPLYFKEVIQGEMTAKEAIRTIRRSIGR